MSDTFQLFPALDGAVEDALRESIKRFGVLVPVAKDQNGRVLDGYHRSRIADELGVDFRVDVHVVADDDEARDIAHTLNADRRQMSMEQRRAIVAALREQGHSLRAIAGAVGVDAKTVRNDLSTGDISPVAPDRVKGLDGKSRPAKRTVVAAKTQKEAGRAQAAINIVGEDLPATVIDTKRAERLARETQAEAQRNEAVPERTNDGDIEILHGDFLDVLPDVLVGSVIISDPPYPREYLPLWGSLAQVALERGASRMVLMCGQSILPEAIALTLDAGYLFGPHDQLERWRFRWCGAYLTPGPATRVWGNNVSAAWKPILVFDRLGDDRTFITRDVFQSTGDDKRHHYWGQNEEGFAQLVETFSKPGGLVVDPFLGGGTTAIVCRDLGRKFIGCDIDAAAVNATIRRLAT